MITIIDYGSGNLKSIKNGFSKIGADATVSSSVEDINAAEALVLPGVGAFGNAMENLSVYKKAIKNHVADGKPLLGVCLGLQVLFSSSEESPGIKGLDIFKGEVVHFPNSLKNEGLKIPQMGWNQLEICNECSILRGVEQDYMYFVHSYYVKTENINIVSATVDYSVDVPAVICQDNVFATQFHPEKSGEIGLKILKNFVEIVG
jgi:imidazole glycerol-phosphate synthase subunit HisH